MASWPPRPASSSLIRSPLAAAGSSPSNPWPPASAAAGHFASGAGFPSIAPVPPPPGASPPSKLGAVAALVRVPKGPIPKGTATADAKGGGKGRRFTPYEVRIGVKHEAPATPPDESPDEPPDEPPADAAGDPDPHGVEQLEDHVLEMHCHGVA